MSAYPVSFPLLESVELVQILRQNQVKEKKAVFARHLWSIQGFAMKSMIGDPDVVAITPPTVTTTPATPAIPATPSTPAIPATPPLLPPIFGDLGLFSAQNLAIQNSLADELEKRNVSYTAGEFTAQLAVPWKLIFTWAVQELVVVLAS